MISVSSDFNLERIQGLEARMHQTLQSDALRNVEIEIKTIEGIRALSKSHVWL